MRLGIIILLACGLIWILSLNKVAEKIGDLVTRFIINPIKGLFE